MVPAACFFHSCYCSSRRSRFPAAAIIPDVASVATVAAVLFLLMESLLFTDVNDLLALACFLAIDCVLAFVSFADSPRVAIISAAALEFLCHSNPHVCELEYLHF